MNDEDIKILEILKETLIKDKFIIPKEPKKWCEAIENLLNRNKELEEENTVLKKSNNISENVTIKDITKFMNKSIEDFNKEYVPVSKIKEIVDECIPRGKNIITGVEEYQTNANANSYLAQEILKLLEGK